MGHQAQATIRTPSLRAGLAARWEIRPFPLLLAKLFHLSPTLFHQRPSILGLDLAGRSTSPFDPEPDGDQPGSAVDGAPASNGKGSEGLDDLSFGCTSLLPFKRHAKSLDRCPSERRPSERDRPRDESLHLASVERANLARRLRRRPRHSGHSRIECVQGRRRHSHEAGELDVGVSGDHRAFPRRRDRRTPARPRGQRAGRSEPFGWSRRQPRSSPAESGEAPVRRERREVIVSVRRTPGANTIA